ncbi:alanine dehydrogenase [Sulfidibacter corallicola]|uniref:Alanine dehydrogenase n=1 Tax=Sulfidibacter corallicola TaxID=2818388 RepID=A0A8A4TUS5_SULCO|nr:alanine dehydrogenase [Sulfidibacter corallicola]QTD52884.1 alanine dehydrogenase [Sulfidibacter corallicola]
MIIGTPKEIKNQEFRVGLIPAGVKSFVNAGHQVLIETNAGQGSGFPDEEYVEAGATIVDSAREVFERADMIIKVKEPQEVEYRMLREGQVLFTYLHLAPDPAQTKGLLESGCIAIAYETITDRDGRLPLLGPMSEVAGRMSVQVGAHYLQATKGGLGMLLGGVPGVEPAEVMVLGGGIVGLNATKMAIGLGAQVTIFERSVDRMRYLDDIFGARITCLMSNEYNISKRLEQTDLVIGGVLIPGANAPKLITKYQIENHMKPGSVIVDVAVDQGGCIETTRPTTHDDPVFTVGRTTQYCVANMPGAVPRTSTFALTNVTLPYALRLANQGVDEAIRRDEHLRAGVNVYKGKLTYEAVAEDQDLEFTDIQSLLAS